MTLQKIVLYIIVFFPLITMEEDAITQRNLEILTDILEYGSVEVYSIGT